MKAIYGSFELRYNIININHFVDTIGENKPNYNATKEKQAL
jgi:hypothetical protein